jgi:hypothetical protein
MKMRTYLVWTPMARARGYADEIDVEAGSPARALELAKATATGLYGPEFELEEIEAGGSGGLVQWASF